MTQSWNVSVEQQFSNDLVMHLAYVGSESYHQTLIIDANPGQTAAAVRGKRALTNYGQILTINSNGTASYNLRGNCLAALTMLDIRQETCQQADGRQVGAQMVDEEDAPRIRQFAKHGGANASHPKGDAEEESGDHADAAR